MTPQLASEAVSFVYFAQAGGDRGPIKIGYSTDVEKRVDSLRTGNHLPIKLLARFQHSNALAIERGLHAAFADLRLEGEWFTFDDRIADVIDAWRLIEHDQGAQTPTSGAALLSRIKNTRVPISTLGECGWWVVEWSHSQGRSHVDRLTDVIGIGLDILLFGRGEPTDYVILAVVETEDEAHALAEALEPWLRAMRCARLLGLGDGYPWWRGHDGRTAP